MAPITCSQLERGKDLQALQAEKAEHNCDKEEQSSVSEGAKSAGPVEGTATNDQLNARLAALEQKISVIADLVSQLVREHMPGVPKQHLTLGVIRKGNVPRYERFSTAAIEDLGLKNPQEVTIPKVSADRARHVRREEFVTSVATKDIHPVIRAPSKVYELSAETLFDNMAMEPANLQGIRLELPRDRLLQGNNNWKTWLNLIVGAMESTGWVIHQPLTALGDARLNAIINQNTAAEISAYVMIERSGQQKLLEWQKAFMATGLRRKRQAAAELQDLRIGRIEGSQAFINRFKATVSEYRQHTAFPGEQEVYFFLRAVEREYPEWVRRMTQLSDITPYSAQKIRELFLEEISGQRKSLKYNYGAQSYETRLKDIICYNCAEKGHRARNCQNPL